MTEKINIEFLESLTASVIYVGWTVDFNETWKLVEILWKEFYNSDSSTDNFLKEVLVYQGTVCENRYEEDGNTDRYTFDKILEDVHKISEEKILKLPEKANKQNNINPFNRR